MTSTIDLVKKDAFGQTMMEILNHAGLAVMISLGHRSRLFDGMAQLAPSTSRQIAEATGLNERYVREWLGAMVVGGVVEYAAELQTYRLPPEHAAWLTRAATPDNVAVATQWIAVMGQVEDDVLAAFRHGKGVPYSAYHRFHEVMAEESSQSVVAALKEHILPLVAGLIERLTKGIDVLDVGCGSGRAMLQLAQEFPKSRFTGYDFSDEGIGVANAQVKEFDLSNIKFEVRDVAAFDDRAGYDLITAFDAIHDQAQPDRVLRNIAQALRPEGVFLMQDIMGTGHVDQDKQLPLSPLTYAMSCMHCMSVSLACGGPGLGAMWGKELALKMLAAAGFKQVRVETLSHDALNFYYVAKLT